MYAYKAGLPTRNFRLGTLPNPNLRLHSCTARGGNPVVSLTR